MIHEAIGKIAGRIDLTEAEMTAVMELISSGQATPAQIGAFLTALRMKGECIDEIVGAVRVLREKSLRVPVQDTDSILIDTCGTGGDGAGTFNVSTTAAFVVAGCGLKVAKHGNRSVSSRCGSADVMEALGVNLDLTPEEVGECIDRAGIGFLFAPSLHPAMKHAIHPRREIGLKSIFNVIGPLTNPAGANVQVLGVYQSDLTETLAEVLGRLGSTAAMVVHGEDGLDEISITGPTRISHLSQGRTTSITLCPEDVGLKRAGMEDILGGDAEENARTTLGILKGVPGPKGDMVLLNAAAAVVAAGQAQDISEGVKVAAQSVDSGKALARLEELIEISQALGSKPRAAEA